MAKEKADSNKRGWFARWRERRRGKQIRAGDMERRLYDQYSKDAERFSRSSSHR